jgi:8-amino-7-oxononanoate synthase
MMQTKPRTLETAVRPEIVIDGKRYVNFGGSAYLGLASRPEILSAGLETLQQCGSGAPLARSHRVFTHAHQQVESEAATFFRSEAALFLSSGYYFGLIALAAIRTDFGAIFFDELAHFSLREAIAASGLKSYAFRHLDACDLRTQLTRHLGASETPLVVTDGLFSAWGEIAPLDEILQAIAPYEGRLLVDESHSFGVLGATGRGVGEHAVTLGFPVLRGGSLGKAFGTCGGIIPASEEEVASFRCTPAGRGASAGLPAAAAMCAASLRYVRHHPELLQRLRENIVYMKSGLRRLGLDVRDSLAPVATFVTDRRASLSALKEELMSEGIFVYHSTYLGAGTGGAIRCGVFADHTTEHIDRLISALSRLL